MSDMNGLPPDDPFGTEGGNPSPMGIDPPNPMSAPPDPSMMPPPMSGGYPQQPTGGFELSMGTKIGTLIMLGTMTLLIPMGLYKIGSPAACTAGRAKSGDCIV